MSTQTLTAEERKITGRKVKTLREKGLIPANVFGKDVKSYAVSVSADDFTKVFEEAGETGIIDLSVGKKKNPVLVSNTQVHPINGGIIHVDFRQIDLTKKITATVPVELTGESPAEKSGLGTVVQQVTELDVEALPTNLPESFIVDVATLTEVDQTIHVSDLKYDKSKVTIEAEDDQIVAKVEPPAEEEIIPVATEETPEGAEGEEIAEGETPAEGQEADSKEDSEETKEE
jgi:large subunit ribosomal protein L25